MRYRSILANLFSSAVLAAASILLALPLSGLLKESAEASVSRQIGRIEDAVGLNFEFRLSERDFLRGLVLFDVTVTDRSVIPNVLLTADSLAVDFSLPDMILRSSEVHPVQVALSGFSAVITEHSLRIVQDARRRGIEALPRDAEPKNRLVARYITQAKKWASRVAEGLLISFSASDGTIRWALPFLRGVLEPAFVEAIVDSGGLRSGSVIAETVDLQIDIPSGSELSLAGQHHGAKAQRFEARIVTAGEDTGNNAEPQRSEYDVMFSLAQLSTEAVSDALENRSSSSVRTITSSSLDQPYFFGASEIRGDIRVDLGAIRAERIEVTIDTFTGRVPITSQDSGTVSSAGEKLGLSADTILISAIPHESEGRYRWITRADNLRGRLIDDLSEETDLAVEIDSPRFSMFSRGLSLADLSAFVWSSDSVTAEGSYPLYGIRNASIHFPSTSAELFRNPAGRTLNILFSSPQIAAVVNNDSADFQDTDAGSSFPDTAANFGSTMVLLEFSGSTLLDLSLHTDTLKVTALSEKWQLESESDKMKLYVETLDGRIAGNAQFSTRTDFSAVGIDPLFGSASIQLIGSLDPSTSQSQFTADLADLRISASGDSFIQPLLSLEIQLTPENTAASAAFSREGADTAVSYSTSENRLNARFNLDRFAPDMLFPAVQRYFPELQEYLFHVENSSLTGTVFLDLPLEAADEFIDPRGLNYSCSIVAEGIALDSAYLLEPLSLSAEGNARQIVLDQISGTFKGFAFTAAGILDFNPLVPDLVLTLQPPSAIRKAVAGFLPDFTSAVARITGTSLLSGSIELLLPDLPDFRLVSSYAINPDTFRTDLDGSAAIDSGEYKYNLAIDPEALRLEGEILAPSSGDHPPRLQLSLGLTLDDNLETWDLSGAYDLSRYSIAELLPIIPGEIEIEARGMFTLSSSGLWNLGIDSGQAANLQIRDFPTTLSFANATVDASSAEIGRIFFSDSRGSLFGSGSIAYPEGIEGMLSGAFELQSADPSSESAFSAGQIERYSIQAALQDIDVSLEAVAEHADLSRFFGDFASGTAGGTLKFEGSRKEYLLSAELSIEEGRIFDNPFHGYARLRADNDAVFIEQFSGSYGMVSVENLTLNYNVSSGFIEADSFQTFQTRSGEVSFGLGVQAQLDTVETAEDFPFEQITTGEVPLLVLAYDIRSNDILLLEEFPAALTLSSGAVSLTGGNGGSISIEINRFGELKASIGQLPGSDLPFSLSLAGTYIDRRIDLVSKDVRFSLTALNPMMRIPEYLQFTEGDVYGSIAVAGSLADPDFYGELFCDVARAVSGSLKHPVKAEHVTGTISEKTLYLNPFHAQVDNTFVRMGVTVDMEYVVPYYYQVSFDIPSSGYVAVQHTFNSFGMVYNGNIDGRIVFTGAGKEMEASGIVYIKDGLISMLPENQRRRNPRDVSASFIIGTRSNVKAVLPSLDLPVISATIDENQLLNVDYQAGTRNYTVDGNIGILGGEIFYFQRSFFITGGMLRLRETHRAPFDPRISIEARLRDVDRQGEKIDILLSIQDNPLRSLSPTLSSRPSRNLAEIADILGRNILPGTLLGDTSFSSAIALATLATDVIQQLGIIELDPISDFESMVRNNLQLDLFSIRTQVFQNIILDTLTSSQIQMLSVNPIARYLDNTSIFLGKYINRDLFLQGMLHLSVDDRSGSGLFMTDDLKLDIELSIEWENPLYFLRVSTQPAGLQPYQMLDALTLGVSWSFSF